MQMEQIAEWFANLFRQRPMLVRTRRGVQVLMTLFACTVLEHRNVLTHHDVGQREMPLMLLSCASHLPQGQAVANWSSQTLFACHSHQSLLNSSLA